MYDAATYSEIIEKWDLDDLLECHRALNLKGRIDRVASESSKSKARKKF